MSGHTPGPWRVEQDVVNNGDIDVFAEDTLAVAFVNVREDSSDIQNIPREVALANARLIAAAPDLYAVCKLLQDTAPESDSLPEMAQWLLGIFNAANAAIAKAEGK